MSLDLNYFIHCSGYGLGTVNVERTHRIMHVRESIYTKEDTLERNRISMRDLIPYAPLDFKIEESDEQMFEYVEGNYSNWRRLGGGATVQGIITEGEMDMDTVHLVFVVQESAVVPAKRSRPSEEESSQALQRQRQLELQQRPVLFPTEAGKYFHIDPGAFGWQLEPTDEWWNFYFFWTNQSFDIEFKKSVVALATNEQGLDDPNHRLSELPETSGCLYVLPFYRRLTERIFIFRREDPEKGIVLTGQPGTGKTTWLWYMLICCLMKHENVLFHYKAETRFFFEGRVYWAGLNATLVKKGLFSWSLIDLDERVAEPPAFLTQKGLYIFPIHASSPNIKRYKTWLKERDGYIWGMPLWTLKEMMQGLEIHRIFIPFVNALREALNIEWEAGGQTCTMLGTVAREESKPGCTESDNSDDNNAMLVESNNTAQMNLSYAGSRVPEPTKEGATAIKGMNAVVKKDAIRNAMRFAKDDKGNRNNAETVFKLLVKDAVHRYGEAVRDIRSAVFDGFAQAEKKYRAALTLDTATLDALIDALARIGTDQAPNPESFPHKLFSVEPVGGPQLSNEYDTFIPKFKSDQIGKVVMERVRHLHLNQARKLSHLFGMFPESSTLGGWIFESYACHLLGSGNIQQRLVPMPFKSCTDTHRVYEARLHENPRTPFPNRMRKQASVTFPDGKLVLDEPGNIEDCLWVPASRNHPLFDAFFVDLDVTDSSVTSTIWIAQMSLSATHNGSLAGYAHVKSIVQNVQTRAEALLEQCRVMREMQCTVKYLYVCPMPERQRTWRLPSKGWDVVQGDVFCLHLDCHSYLPS